MNKGDIVLLALLIVTFATLVTAHLTIAVGLFLRTQRLRSLLAFLVAPLAPYFAIQGRMYVRGIAWLLGAVGYVVVRRLAV